MGETVDPVRPFLLFGGLCAVFFRRYSAMQVKLKPYEVRNATAVGALCLMVVGGGFGLLFS